MENLEEIDDEELVHDIATESVQETPSDTGIGIPLLHSSTAAMEERPYITYLSQLKSIVPKTMTCSACQTSSELSWTEFGSSLVLKWVSFCSHLM